MLFIHLKRILNLDRLTLRGTTGACRGAKPQVTAPLQKGPAFAMLSRLLLRK